MRGSYAAELIKLRKRWATWVLLIVSIVLNQVFGYFVPYTSYISGVNAEQTSGNSPEQVLAGALPDQFVATALGSLPLFTGAFALIIGALAAGSEYNWGTMKTALIQRPARMQVFGGKLLAIVAVMAGMTVVIFGLAALSSTIIALTESRPVIFPTLGTLVVGLLAGWLILTMWALFGAMLGISFRSVAVPIGLGVIWIVGLENLISNMANELIPALGPVRDLLPAVNAGSLVWAQDALAQAGIDAPPVVSDAVSGTRAAVTLVVYAGLFVVLAGTLFRRRDVT